jgi:hypothetical protein
MHFESEISQIEDVRRDNNKLWMDILRIAMELAPGRTKDVIRKINENDKKISDLLGKMT